jgi:hypothetical protein
MDKDTKLLEEMDKDTELLKKIDKLIEEDWEGNTKQVLKLQKKFEKTKLYKKMHESASKIDYDNIETYIPNPDDYIPDTKLYATCDSSTDCQDSLE